MQTYNQALIDNPALTLDEYKLLYRQQCHQAIADVAATVESMKFVGKSALSGCFVFHKEVDYE
jgi:hypothetical protein